MQSVLMQIRANLADILAIFGCAAAVGVLLVGLLNNTALGLRGYAGFWCVVLTSFCSLMVFVAILSKKHILLMHLFEAVMQLPFIIIFYAALYYDCGLRGQICFDSLPKCGVQTLHDGLSSIYFSTITLTTVGYGDFIPSNQSARLAASCEALTGYLVMSFLVAAILRFAQNSKE